MTTNINNFIAPNGARVTFKDWGVTIKAFPTAVMMQVIFNDPLLEELA